MKSTKGSGLVRALKLIEFMSKPGWKSTKDVAAELGVCIRSANRWVNALDEAGIPIETQSETGERTRQNCLFRRFK